MPGDTEPSTAEQSEGDDAPSHPSQERIEEKDETPVEINAIPETATSIVPVSQDAGPVAKEDFSVFTVPQKRAIIIACSFAGWFSPMTGSIYYPALTQIADDLHVSDAKISLTVTTYLIFQGLAPMMIAGFSDKAGRRPAYFICFAIYIVANLALGLQNNYYALLILRMLQSAGSSGTIALANGVVGDLITSAERGKYIAYASIGVLLGPTVSPVIGGLISQYADWHWIFWFLLILSCIFFIPFALFMPETCRTLVDDGSIPPPRSSANLTDARRFRNNTLNGTPINETKLATLRQNHKLSIPNPIGTLRVLADFQSTCIILPTGLAIASFYAISTGAAQSFGTLYGFHELKVSLIFIPIGAGSIISAFTTGKLVDWNYRRIASRLNFPVTKNRFTDLSDFPIERARLQIAVPMYLLAALSIVGYGWMMDHRISLAGPVIMLFLLGYCIIAGSQCMNVLIVDVYPGQPATATAANNVFRCLLGAAATAAIVPLTERVGHGWAYTILAGLLVVSLGGSAASWRWGMGWRRARKVRLAEKAEKKAAAQENKEAV